MKTNRVLTFIVAETSRTVWTTSDLSTACTSGAGPITSLLEGALGQKPQPPAER